MGGKTVAFLESPKRGGIKVAASTLPSSGPLGVGRIKVAVSPVPSWGPQAGLQSKGLHSPDPLMVPNVWKKQSGYITLAFLAHPKVG